MGKRFHCESYRPSPTNDTRGKRLRKPENSFPPGTISYETEKNSQPCRPAVSQNRDIHSSLVHYPGELTTHTVSPDLYRDVEASPYFSPDISQAYRKKLRSEYKKNLRGKHSTHYSPYPISRAQLQEVRADPGTTICEEQSPHYSPYPTWRTRPPNVRADPETTLGEEQSPHFSPYRIFRAQSENIGADHGTTLSEGQSPYFSPYLIPESQRRQHLEISNFPISAMHILDDAQDSFHLCHYGVNQNCNIHTTHRVCDEKASPYFSPDISQAYREKLRSEYRKNLSSQPFRHFSLYHITKEKRSNVGNDDGIAPANTPSALSLSPLIQETRNRPSSGHDILGDFRDLFAEGHTGVINWSDEMLTAVLKGWIWDRWEAAKENGAPDKNQVGGEHIIFYSERKESVDPCYYIRRVIRKSDCSKTAFVIMQVYLDRCEELYKDLMLSEMNWHRVLFTALLLAIKYLEDEVRSNRCYAKVCGVGVVEMNELERKMLHSLGWNLSVSHETYKVYEGSMVQSARMLLTHLQSGGALSEE